MISWLTVVVPESVSQLSLSLASFASICDSALVSSLSTAVILFNRRDCVGVDIHQLFTATQAN